MTTAKKKKKRPEKVLAAGSKGQDSCSWKSPWCGALGPGPTWPEKALVGCCSGLGPVPPENALVGRCGLGSGPVWLEQALGGDLGQDI